jgi:hypothetical protein
VEIDKRGISTVVHLIWFFILFRYNLQTGIIQLTSYLMLQNLI